MTTNDTTATRDQIAAAVARRYADLAPIVWPAHAADRSRNGRRIPRSVKHRAFR